MLDNECYIDAIVVGRRIIEIYIRMSYLIKENKYEQYVREKYVEKAMSLYSMLKSHRIEDCIDTSLWKERVKIIDENKKLRDDIKTGTLSKINSIEDMAKSAGLSFLYNNAYRNWCKVCHCNMSVESSVIYKSDNKLCYCIDKNTPEIVNQKCYVLQVVNSCIFASAKLYCSVIHIKENILKDFQKINAIFIAFDLVTGKRKNVGEITQSMMENYFGEKVNLNLGDKVNLNGDVSEDFYKIDPSVFVKEGKDGELKDLIKKKENELQNKN